MEKVSPVKAIVSILRKVTSTFQRSNDNDEGLSNILNKSFGAHSGVWFKCQISKAKSFPSKWEEVGLKERQSIKESSFTHTEALCHGWVQILSSQLTRSTCPFKQQSTFLKNQDEENGEDRRMWITKALTRLLTIQREREKETER